MNTYWVNKEIKGEIKILEDKWKYDIPKSIECDKGGTERKVYRNTGLSQEIRKISSKWSNLTCKGTRRRRANEAQRWWKQGSNIEWK